MNARLGKIAFQVGVIAVTLALVLWATGVFHRGRIEPVSVPSAAAVDQPAHTTRVLRETVTVVEEIVGTVESRVRAAIAAQVSAQVVSVTKEAGAVVTAGEVVIHLDDRELSARHGQATQALAAAGASLERAKQARVQADARLTFATAHHERVQGYLVQGAATPEQMEAAASDLAQAKAGVAEAEAMIAAASAGRDQAREAVQEAQVALGYTVIVAPMNGVVAQRAVEPGEIAWPGRTLLVVHDPHALRLSTPVREGLIGHVIKGSEMEVHLPAIGQRVKGTIAEVIPSGDPRSRTFEVRVHLGEIAGLYPGMFGRLRLSIGEREIVSVPASAVGRVGQLETVLVQVGARWSRRLITTGARTGDLVEVLSGLQGGETVAITAEGGR